MSKTVLIICQKAPWQGVTSREALDLALSGGAFDISISMLFLDDGLLQLMPSQKANTIEQKDICANLQALSLFGIDELLVCEHNLFEYAVTQEQLSLPVKIVSQHELSQLFQYYNIVLSF